MSESKSLIDIDDLDEDEQSEELEIGDQPTPITNIQDAKFQHVLLEIYDLRVSVNNLFARVAKEVL